MRFVASRLDRYFGSFKFRLAAYFLLLSLLPLMGAVWAFSEVASRSEVGRTDARLNAALRASVGDFTSRVDEAQQAAVSLAHATAFHHALAEPNRGALARLYREAPNAAFYSRGQLLAGDPPPSLGIRRTADVLDERGRPLGRVVVSIPLDDELVARLRARPGFSHVDRLALVADGRTIVGPRGIARVRLPMQTAADLRLDGENYRALATSLSSGNVQTTLVAFTPRAEISAETAALKRRMLLLAALALAVAGALAYFLGRTIVRQLKQLSDAAGAIARGNFSSRVPVRGRDEFSSLSRAFNDMAAQLESRLEELAWERGRTRDAISRFGEALAATTNPFLLVPVIVESTVEATGAAGGRLILNGEELARAGDPDAGPEPLEIPLTTESGETGSLLLTPPGADFSDDARELAYWLASQARAALENASLHKRLELEAVTDGLTELPNRRQFQHRLAQELVRAERFENPLALVVADLDNFKQVNDRHGHLAGDDVLRAFSEILRDAVREVDTAARYGGEEFALLLPETDVEGARVVAERVRVALEARRFQSIPGSIVSATASFGIAAYPEVPTAEELFAAADLALYRAKAGGKNRVETAPGETRAVPA
jgi:diguanylate cyclase (GGDEF)-like protein